MFLDYHNYYIDTKMYTMYVMLTRLHVHRSQTNARLGLVSTIQPLLSCEGCPPCHCGVWINIILEILHLK